MTMKGGADDSTMDSRLLMLSSEDNVLIARIDLAPGERLDIDGATVTLKSPAPAGFKVARRNLEPGQHVVKYGAPIGSATKSIAVGDVVHLDNMKSDYLPTYTFDKDSKFTKTGDE